MKNTNNTSKVRRANKKIAATICAIVAATAMVTGIAVFTASANTIESAPSRISTAFSTTVKADTVDTAKIEKTETAPKTEKTEKAAQPEEKKADDTVNANGKHPGESGYNYQGVAETNDNAQAQQQSPAAEQTQQAAETEKHPGEAGCNYVNETGKHPGESGYNYQGVVEQTAATTPTSVFSGDFVAVNNTNTVLSIVKADMYDTAYCTIKVAQDGGKFRVYNFMAPVYEDKMYYAGGTVTEITYDANGTVVESKVVDSNHTGHVVMTKEGYVWVDSDETHCVFAY